jgi:hypothetical protein
LSQLLEHREVGILDGFSGVGSEVLLLLLLLLRLEESGTLGDLDFAFASFAFASFAFASFCC